MTDTGLLLLHFLPHSFIAQGATGRFERCVLWSSGLAIEPFVHTSGGRSASAFNVQQRFPCYAALSCRVLDDRSQSVDGRVLATEHVALIDFHGLRFLREDVMATDLVFLENALFHASLYDPHRIRSMVAVRFQNMTDVCCREFSAVDIAQDKIVQRPVAAGFQFLFLFIFRDDFFDIADGRRGDIESAAARQGPQHVTQTPVVDETFDTKQIANHDSNPFG